MSREVKYTLTVDSKTGKANLGSFERQAASTTKTLQDQTKTVNAGERAFSSFGKVIAAVGGAAALFSLASMTKQFVGLAMAQQDAEIAMSSALKVTGEYTDEINKKLQDFASSIQAATTYGDEEVLKLMALQKNLGVTTNRLEAAAQMSIGLAAATGRNAESMAMYVALAEQGEYTMLNRYIPALRSAKTETEKLQVLTDFCARGFEVAKSKTETFSGALKQTSNTFGDLKEKIGDFVVKNAVAVEAVKVADQLFRDWQEEIKLTADHFNAWALANKELIKSDVKGFLIGTKDALIGIWNVLSYDPAIFEFGIVGLAIWGRKGAVVLGAIGHTKTWVENLAAALGLASAGMVEFSEIASANFKELEAILDRFDQKAPGGGIGDVLFRGKISWPGGDESGGDVTGGGDDGGNNEAILEATEALEKAKRDSWQASTDFWLLQAQDRYDISRRVLEAEIELESQASEAKKVVMDNAAIAETASYRARMNTAIAWAQVSMNVASMVNTFTTKESMAMFVVAKAIETAMAIMHGHQAAIAAAAAVAGIPIIGPALAAEQFAQWTAIGYANAAIIAGTAIGQLAMGGGGGVSVPSMGTSTANEPVTPLDMYAGEDAEKRGTLIINLNGDVLADEYYIELLAEKISEAVEDRDVKLTATYSNTAGAVA